MRVLVVEDEVYLAESIAAGLRLEAMSVDMVHDGGTALEALDDVQYDAVVLDRDIPVIGGDEVCQRIVERGGGPAVLMLTAARTLDQKLHGFHLGADDYLAKPFDFPELVARLRSLHRRSTRADPPVLAVAGIRLDPFRREVYRQDRFIRLTRKEFAVLEVLMRQAGGVISAETLLEKAWDDNANPFTNAIKVTVSTLRKKLGDPPVIATVHGVGYRIVTDETTHSD